MPAPLHNDNKPPNRRPAGVVPPALLLLTDEVLSVTRMSRTTLWRRLREGAFPPPIEAAGDHRRWRRADIEAYANGEWKPAEATSVCVG